MPASSQQAATLNPSAQMMPLNPRHLARLASAAVVMAALTGCQAIVSSPSVSQVRIINASPDTPGVDIYQGNDGVAYNLGFGAVTSYVPISSGTYSISADTAGTRQVLSLAKPSFVPSSQYTILISNTSDSLQQLILKDQNQPAPTGQFALRFLHQATRTGAVDLYLVPSGHPLTTVSPTLTNIRFGESTPYQNLSAGTYTPVILPAGTTPTNTLVPSFTGAQVIYPSTAARTMILIDQPLPTMSVLQVITTIDYDPAAS
ncbi:MAG: DUF4397 domain-containing protein [Edaphobacter sp.]